MILKTYNQSQIARLTGVSRQYVSKKQQGDKRDLVSVMTVYENGKLNQRYLSPAVSEAIWNVLKHMKEEDMNPEVSEWPGDPE